MYNSEYSTDVAAARAQMREDLEACYAKLND